MPWYVFNQGRWMPMFVQDKHILENFIQKADPVWNEAVTLSHAAQDTTSDPSAVASWLLAERIFSPLAERRDSALRMAFEACIDPDQRQAFMIQGSSNYIWFVTRCCFASDVVEKGDPVAQAMVDMLEVLKQEVPTLHMGMAGDSPAVLWDDLLVAVGAKNDRKVGALLREFIEEEYAALIDGRWYVSVDSLIWALPKMVLGLSGKPSEKRHLVDAGYKIFSATMRSRSEAQLMISEIIKSEVEENGLGVIQEAETEARYALGLGEHRGAPTASVSVDQDGVVKVTQTKPVIH